MPGRQWRAWWFLESNFTRVRKSRSRVWRCPSLAGVLWSVSFEAHLLLREGLFRSVVRRVRVEKYPSLSVQLSRTMMPEFEVSKLARNTSFGAPPCNRWFLYGATKLEEDLRSIPLEAQPFTIGRREENSLCLHFRTVSGNHASLIIQGNELFLEDLQSTNGTYVNGDRIEGHPVRVCEDDLLHFAEAPFRVRRQSAEHSHAGTVSEDVCEQAYALVQFDRLMSQRLVLPLYQPIVRLANGSLFGFEALGRGRVFGLESIQSLFRAAAQLNMEVELSELLRRESIRVAREAQLRSTLFFNMHPKELQERHFLESLATTREMAGEMPLVLEVHESAITGAAALQELAKRLESLNIGLAFDDFGSGQARLAELTEARPDYVKFDIQLIRGIDQGNADRLRMLKNLTQMVRDLEIQSLAEGVETQGEADCCRELGFDLVQGFFFGFPAPLKNPTASSDPVAGVPEFAYNPEPDSGP